MCEIGKPERTKSSYSVEIPIHDFLNITRAENDYRIPYEASLSARLEGIGPTRSHREMNEVYSVEYNGHFGAAIYYDVDAEEDTDATHEKVRAIIKSQIQIAQAFFDA